MKITKSQLKQIIKEELEKVMDEGMPGWDNTGFPNPWTKSKYEIADEERRKRGEWWQTRPDIRSKEEEDLHIASMKRAAKQFQADLDTRAAAKAAKDKLRPHRYRVTADGEAIGTYATKKEAWDAIAAARREILGPTPMGIETKAQRGLTYPEYDIVPLDPSIPPPKGENRSIK